MKSDYDRSKTVIRKTSEYYHPLDPPLISRRTSIQASAAWISYQSRFRKRYPA